MSNVQQLIDQSKSNLNRKMLKTNKKNVITIHKNQAQKPKQTPEVNEIDDNLVQLRFVRGRFSPFWVWWKPAPSEPLATAALECKTFYVSVLFFVVRQQLEQAI